LIIKQSAATINIDMQTPSLSLTDLVDVILKSGLPKATKVKQIKYRPGYEPAFDFYKPLREAIVDAHKLGQSKKQFQVTAGAAAHPKKQGNYSTAISGYVKWWGTKQFIWRNPPRTTYSANGVDVIVNPELGLEWNGSKHLVKLYLKDAPLAKNRADLILSMLEVTLKPSIHGSITMGLLDVRNSKLFTTTSLNPTTKAVLDGELAYIAAIWPTL